MTGRIVGIDIGGTHTDCVLVDPDDGTVTIAKLPTTTEDPSAGFLDGLSRLSVGLGKSVGTIVHGTTIATNAVLERRGARCGLITTGGFRDVLELGRRIREHVYGLSGGFEPLIPRELRLEVRERMNASGDVLIPLHEGDVQAAVRQLRKADVEAVVIHFLHAYANPSHERRCRELVLDAWPGIDVSLGSDVLPEFREFERGTAAAISGYVQPLIGRYVDRLETRLRESGLGERLQIMKSNGGMVRAGLARSQAVQLVLSGPAAGAVAAGRIARAAGFRDAVACDMGGTSFDVTLIRDGEPTLTHEKELGYGLPLHVPMIDVHTIGAGGGSVAWVDAGGLLRVGPESAGAYPGPVAYGRGGTRPTVTDANLLLGRMDPAGVNGVPGGADLDTATRALKRHVAEPLGLHVEEAAEAVLEIVNNAMAGTIRAAALARGLDPRSLALIAFGGGGAMHACALARELSVSAVVVPRYPGLLSALGAALADVRHDFSRALGQELATVRAGQAEEILRGQEAEGRTLLAGELVALDGEVVRREADLLYAGQTHVVRVPLPDGPFDKIALAKAFTERMVARFGFAPAGLRPVLVALRTSVIGVRSKVPLQALVAEGETVAEDGRCAHRLRSVRFGGVRQQVSVLRRASLLAGDRVAGPAIIEQMDATIVLHPSDEAVADGLGNLIISVAPAWHA